MKTWLLNNCNNLDHPVIYGRKPAFFDLWATAIEDRRANEMSNGDRCFVLSQRHGRIVVEEFNLAIKIKSTDRNNEASWCLVGPFVRGVVLTREEAEAHEVYRYFFNSVGHLNQWSIMRWLSTAEIVA